MPATSNVGQFAGSVRSVGTAVMEAQKKAVTAAANEIRKGAQGTLDSAAPGGKLRNFKGVAKLSVRVTGDSGGASAIVRGNGGAYAILDNEIRAHYVGQGRSTKKVKKGFAGPSRPGKGVGHPMLTPYGWRTGPFLIRLHDGKHTFNIGTEAATDAATAALTDVLTQAAQKAVNS